MSWEEYATWLEGKLRTDVTHWRERAEQLATQPVKKLRELLQQADEMHLGRCASSEPFTAQDYRNHACDARTLIREARALLSVPGRYPVTPGQLGGLKVLFDKLGEELWTEGYDEGSEMQVGLEIIEEKVSILLSILEASIRSLQMVAPLLRDGPHVAKIKFIDEQVTLNRAALAQAKGEA